MANVVDLDVLRPESDVVRLGGNDIDCTIMPLALTFDINEIITKSAALDTKKLSGNDIKEGKKAFELSIEMCAVFCEHQYPEMDREYFANKVTMADLNILGEHIRAALIRSYEGIDPKNSDATETATENL